MEKEKRQEIEEVKSSSTDEAASAKSGNTGPEAKTEEKKETKKEKPRKEEAIAITNNASVSKKHSMYICSFIKGKNIDLSISDLEEVLKFKKAIPFKGEIPHRHELGGKSGRYPINASKFFIQLLKTLRGNVIVNGLSLDKSKIYFASASWASRSAKRGGSRFKRCHITLKAREAPEVLISRRGKI